MARLLIVLGVLAFAAAPAPAEAASVRAQILRDCEDDGVLQGSYTPAQIRDARQNMPSDIAEYTDCVDVLRRAELAGTADNPSSPPPTSGGGGGEATPDATPAPVATPALVPETETDRQALEGAQGSAGQPVTVGGENLLAGVTPLSVSSDLPAPLLAALISLALAGLALCLPSLRRRALPLLRRR